MKKRIYLLLRELNSVDTRAMLGYGQYVGVVVCATSEEEAKKIHPNGHSVYPDVSNEDKDSWVMSTDDLICMYIGDAVDNLEIGIVLNNYSPG